MNIRLELFLVLRADLFSSLFEGQNMVSQSHDMRCVCLQRLRAAGSPEEEPQPVRSTQQVTAGSCLCSPCPVSHVLPASFLSLVSVFVDPVCSTDQ